MKLTHFVDRHLTTQMAAQPWISSLVSADVFCRYRESGPPGMANRRRGNHKTITYGFAQVAPDIPTWPMLACEKLAEARCPPVKETVRSLMVKAGL
jgi:hypothetical protein